MEFLRLQSPQDPLFQEAFALYETSFPPHEQRLSAGQAAVIANPRYHFDVIREADAFAGILLYWVFPDYAYIEHFAIDTNRRGNSLGSRSLAAFCGRHPLVILEIDPPVDQVSLRRQRFYHKLGFHANPYPHAHPPYRSGHAPHELVVMSSPKALDGREYAAFSRDLAQTVMRDSPAAP